MRSELSKWLALEGNDVSSLCAKPRRPTTNKERQPFGDAHCTLQPSLLAFRRVIMDIRKTSLAAAIAGPFAAPLSLHAANFSVDVDIAPPAPAALRAGCVRNHL